MGIDVLSESVEASRRNIFSYLMIKSLKLNKLKATALRDSLKDYQNKKKLLLERLIRDSQTSSVETTKITLKLLDEAHRALRANGYMTLDITAKTVSRLIVHTNSPFGSLAFEVGLAFHPIFNVPYIPGSSIKGAIRAFAEANELAYNSAEIFGEAGEEISRLLVTDAFPVKFGEALLEPEVTTPIYKETVREHQVSPTPIIYPVIAKGVTFRFIVAMRDLNNEQKQAIKNWIKEVLKEGLGGKTMLGYGRMEETTL